MDFVYGMDVTLWVQSAVWICRLMSPKDSIISKTSMCPVISKWDLANVNKVKDLEM